MKFLRLVLFHFRSAAIIEHLCIKESKYGDQLLSYDLSIVNLMVIKVAITQKMLTENREYLTKEL